MPEYLAPGVFVEETSLRSKAIEGVGTNATGFVGPTVTGPPAGVPELLTSFTDFERVYGGLEPIPGDAGPGTNYVAHAARAFFENDGKRLYVARVPAGADAGAYAGSSDAASGDKTGLVALADVGEISIVAAPGSTAGPSNDHALAVAGHLIAHCESQRYRVAILDSRPGHSVADVRAYRAALDSTRAALYYPWVRILDPLSGVELDLPPSGFIAGIFARTDILRGVHKTPANEPIRLAVGLERPITQAEQEVLNPEGINCVRSFPGRGHLVWGARTISSDPEWKYINVRRYFLYLEQSVEKGTQWAVFEPNGAALWDSIRRAVENFLHNEWRDGRLQGTKPEEAFFVKCDRTTMTQSDIDNGRLICEIGIAPVRPAEFVIFRIGQKTADAAGR